jgi:hypothetical protein
MPLPIIGLLLIKGAAIVVKAIVVQKKVAVVSKGIAIASKTYGAANVAATSGVVLTAVGGVSWTAERYQEVKECYRLWEMGDTHGMIKKMATLTSKISGIYHNPHTIFHSAGELLKANGTNSTNVLNFVKDLSNSADDILREMKREY